MNCGVEWEGPRRMREGQKRRKKKRGYNWSNFCCAVSVRYHNLCSHAMREREAGGRKGGERLEGGMKEDGLLGETVQYRDREWQRASGTASHLSRWYRNGCKHSFQCYRSTNSTALLLALTILTTFLIPINRMQNMMTMYQYHDYCTLSLPV